jgi:peptidylprolyl isomerase
LGFESLPRSLNVRARLLLSLIAALLLAVGVAACGGDDDSSSNGETAATATPTEAPAAPEESADVIAAGITKNTKKKPEIAAPEGEPPAQLVIKDIVKGKGPKAKAGDQLAMQYVGNSWSTGEQFDASWDRGGQPFAFQLGAGMVIPGWDQGMVGMRDGGRRLLIVPPDLGYGAGGTPDGAIAPNETLVFVVDLEKLN